MTRLIQCWQARRYHRRYGLASADPVAAAALRLHRAQRVLEAANARVEGQTQP